MHNKAETVARVEAEYRALDRTVRRLGAKGLGEPIPGFGTRARTKRERWRRKDSLAHIVAWKEHSMRTLRRALGHKEPFDEAMRGKSVDAQNRILYLRWRRRPARAVIAYHRSVQRAIRKAMRALPPAYYAKRFSSLWPYDLAGHSTWHRQHHLENE